MKRFNKHICLGLFFNSIFLIGNRLNIMSEFFKGFFISLGTVLFIYGTIVKKYHISEFDNYKKKLIKQIIKRN